MSKMVVESAFLKREKTFSIRPVRRRAQIRRIVNALELYKERQLKVESSMTVYDVISNYGFEEVISHDTVFHVICYNGCSNINPHLAESCDKLGDYYQRCLTYNAKLNGRMK